jgi:hypothetical protein
MRPEREPKFGGKDLSQEDKDLHSQGFAEKREKAEERIPGEEEKSDEEKLVIRKINEYLNEEFNRLGIEEVVNISESQIHLLPRESFRKLFDTSDEGIDEEVNGVTSAVSNVIYIERGHGDRLQMYQAMFHEAVHLIAFHRWSFDPRSGKQSGRTGYGITKMYPNASREYKLSGFDEGITEAIAREMILTHQADLVQSLKVTEEERKKSAFTYPVPRKILNIIIEKIALTKNIDQEEVWDQIKKGYFTGEMMHLRDIERTFGKGSLEVLSLFDVTSAETFGPEIAKKMIDYFETNDQAQRDWIRQEIVILKHQNRKIHQEESL